MTVYKFPFPVQDEIALIFPRDARILSVGVQTDSAGRSSPVIYALVDPAAPPVGRLFRLMGTGHELGFPSENAVFIGTISIGPFWFHLFELVEKTK